MNKRDYKVTVYASTEAKPDTMEFYHPAPAYRAFMDNAGEMVGEENYGGIYKVTIHALDHVTDRYSLIGKLEK